MEGGADNGFDGSVDLTEALEVGVPPSKSLDVDGADEGTNIVAGPAELALRDGETREDDELEVCDAPKTDDRRLELVGER